ncbi:MAG: hypothetical protein ACLSWI_05585 [Candidatus Gastranaerophilaceae bacterium]
MNNRALLIPTFKGHFTHIIDLIKSMNTFILDKECIDIVFILSSPNEKIEFDELILPLKKGLNIHTYDIETILSDCGKNYTSEQLLKDLGRVSYQTVKKLYPIHYLNYQQVLVFDSESIFLKKTNVNKMFDDYFKNPYIFYSTNSEEEPNVISIAPSTNNSAYERIFELYNTEPDNMWCFEAFHWFYDKNIIDEIFEYFNNNLLERMLEIGYRYEVEYEKVLFESFIYYLYIYKITKNNYRLINVRDEIKENLGGGALFKAYYRLFRDVLKADYLCFPIFLHWWECLRVRDMKKFCGIYKKYALTIGRIALAPLDDAIVYEYIKYSNLELAVSTTGIKSYIKLPYMNLIDKVILNIRFMGMWIRNNKIYKLRKKEK